jgi:hypothetical protein
MNMPPHDVHLNDNVSDQLVPASGVFIAAAGAAFRKVLFSEEVRGGATGSGGWLALEAVFRPETHRFSFAPTFGLRLSRYNEKTLR